MTLKVLIVPVTPFEQNCSILICEETNRAAIVDPGGDIPKILDALNKSGAIPEKILLTHGHIDHCAGAVALAKELNVEIEGPHKDEAFWLDQLPLQSQRLNFNTNDRSAAWDGTFKGQVLPRMYLYSRCL